MVQLNTYILVWSWWSMFLFLQTLPSQLIIHGWTQQPNKLRKLKWKIWKKYRNFGENFIHWLRKREKNLIFQNPRYYSGFNMRKKPKISKIERWPKVTKGDPCWLKRYTFAYITYNPKFPKTIKNFYLTWINIG